MLYIIMVYGETQIRIAPNFFNYHRFSCTKKVVMARNRFPSQGFLRQGHAPSKRRAGVSQPETIVEKSILRPQEFVTSEHYFIKGLYLYYKVATRHMFHQIQRKNHRLYVSNILTLCSQMQVCRRISQE